MKVEVAEAHEEMESVHEELATKQHALVEKDGTIRDLHSEIAVKEEELKVLGSGSGACGIRPGSGGRATKQGYEAGVRGRGRVTAYVGGG